MRKGISPLIAAVLLIAFTMAVAGLAGPFLTEVTQKAQGDTINKSKTIVDSTNARLEVMSTSYNSSNSSYEVTIRNSGTDSVQDFTATIYGDSPKQKQINKKLEAGEVHTFDIEEAGNSTKIEVEVRDLPAKTNAELSQEDGPPSTKTKSISLTSGTFNGTTSYKPNNHDNLSIGYKNGSTSDDLVAYWRLDSDSGSVIDYSGNDNDGSNNGASRGKTGVFGTKGFEFDGDDDYIEVSQDSSLEPDKFTVTLWGYVPSGDTTSMRAIDKGGNDYGYQVIVNPGQSDYSFNVNGNWVTDSSFSTDQWFMQTLTYDGSKMRGYADGEEVASKSVGLSYQQENLDIGRRADESKHWNGRIDEIRIYDRALSQSEIKRLYKYGTPYHGEYNATQINPSGSDHNWTKLEVDAGNIDDSDISLSANFSALDSSGNLVEDQIISIDTNGNKKYNIEVANSDKAIVNFNGTTSSVTKTWEISEANVYYK